MKPYKTFTFFLHLTFFLGLIWLVGNIISMLGDRYFQLGHIVSPIVLTGMVWGVLYGFRGNYNPE